MDQWNKLRSPEMYCCKYSPLIFDKGARAIQWPQQVAPDTGFSKVSSQQLGLPALLPPVLGTTGSPALLFPHGAVWVTSPTAPPLEQFGPSAYCSSPGTIWVTSPIVLPVFGTARTPLKGAADPPVG